ncbi:hypothetical protein Cs7R123_32640 [Catellatospora sp. TT07R-123]|uniref:M23 family metallopeptidase n=1 Tax=Catellatospora sp. TT07R-123 TaxID=2733863 RepID=UPI001B2292A4|nr:M23 family metallopeptidase [Catellatospora sp. TT07R-123]GHJ45922.1 hypothetical protein Cs7R123_32640 [Catellatospora sp. TT07R-123]
MNLKHLGIAAALAPVLLALGVAVSATASGALDPVASTGCLPATGTDPATALALKELSPVQLAHAKTVYQVSAGLKLPPRAAVVALATALQESRLRNLANTNVPNSLLLPHDGVGTDHDSVGLFQQRPLPPDGQGGWGTVKELMIPQTAATKFYRKLTTIKDWQQLPVTVAAQQVQVSAFPDAYAKHEPLATAITLAIGGDNLACTISSGPISAMGWTKPVNGRFASGFHTPDRPTHNGVDVAAPKGTAIYAAAAGKVTVAKCGSANCDIDGSLNMPGCGWYVDITHPDHTLTRYCHMLRRPYVTVGQQVVAGQQIGVVGTSGHSTGPHLHYQTHIGGPSNNLAVDPIMFMAARGVDLTK